jgi:hypothetical protein
MFLRALECQVLRESVSVQINAINIIPCVAECGVAGISLGIPNVDERRCGRQEFSREKRNMMSQCRVRVFGGAVV